MGKDYYYPDLEEKKKLLKEYLIPEGSYDAVIVKNDSIVIASNKDKNLMYTAYKSKERNGRAHILLADPFLFVGIPHLNLAI